MPACVCVCVCVCSVDCTGDPHRRDVLHSHNERVVGCLVSMETALSRSWDRCEGVLQSSLETLSLMRDDNTTATER